MIKPYKILLFFISVFTSLFIISSIFPKDGVIISENIKLQFPEPSDIFKSHKSNYADISDLIQNSEVLNDSIFSRNHSDKKDPVYNENTTYDTVKADAGTLRKNIHPIDFPDNNPRVLYSFFNQLRNIKSSSKQLRILHYGDSQIEGDRITSLVRSKLQDKFGGSGAGLIPVVQPYGQFSIKQIPSDNWKRYTVFGKKDTTIGHNRYGVMASFCRFSPSIYDPDYQQNNYEAWLEIRKAYNCYWNTQIYNSLKIFFGYNKKPFLAELYLSDELVDADIIPACNDLNTLQWHFNSTPEKIMLKFSGQDSPDFYALAIDNHSGIAVDNIAMRGSSGLIFSKIDQDLLKKMYRELNVQLLLLQFGGNVVPYISNNYEYYGKLFHKQLLTLKKIIPDIPIIIIGVADMSVNNNGRFETYPNLPKVRDALRDASFKTGCSYWDMFEAMGGLNSMPSWVYAEPSLASTDFVHFNHRGARLIAEMFYNAFIAEYNKYINLNHSEQNTLVDLE